MAEPNDNDRKVANKLASDAMLRVGDPVATIAWYREQCEAAAVRRIQDAVQKDMVRTMSEAVRHTFSEIERVMADGGADAVTAYIATCRAGMNAAGQVSS